MKIRPFKGIRPDVKTAPYVAALPYDVFNEKEAREEVSHNPVSFLNVDRPETQFEEGHDMYAPEVYEKARELLHKWLRDGILVREEKPVYYLYTLTMNDRIQRGIVACSSADDYIEDRIRKHENTRREKEEDRVRHIDVTSMQTGPIFLAYRQKDEIRALVDEISKKDALMDFISDDGIRHEVRRIDDDEMIGRITKAFDQVENTYIADGHHRAASAIRVCLKRREAHPDYDGSEEFNSFLSVLFADEELSIMDYNRIVLLPEHLSQDPENSEKEQKAPDDLLREIEKYYIVEKKGCAGTFKKPEEKGTCGMYLEGNWYLLKAREEIRTSDPVEGLDVSLLQKYILGPLFDIGDPKTDPKIDFVGGIRGIAELERRADEERSAAFLMVPTSMEELFNVADHKLLMPPKSTWFEPKLRSGLFIHEIEE